MLRRQAVRGAGATVVAGAVGQLIQLVATVALGRLLVPADFGVFAMVATFSMLLANFGLNGFTEVVLQRPEIDHGLASNLFWLNLTAGCLLTIGFAGSGDWLARFYGNPDVAMVTGVMAVSILLSSTSVLHRALLQRAMLFTEVSIIATIARLASVAVSVWLAWKGWGYWALVGGALAQPLIVCLGSWWLCRWIPGLPVRRKGTSSIVCFAMQVYGRFLVNYGTRNLDNALIGWRFNALSLGYYKKAYDLFGMSAGLLVSSLTPVAVSTLSRLSGNPGEYTRSLLRVLNVLAFGGMALGGILTLVGGDVIRLLLGSQWGEAGRIFAFFGPGVGVLLLYGTHGWIHLSLGRPDRWFRWAMLEAGVTGLLFVLALQWGAAAVAAAWTASFWLLSMPALWYAGKPIGLSIRPIVTQIWKYVISSVAAGLATALVVGEVTALPEMPGWVGAAIRIPLVSVCFLALYLASVRVLHGGLEPLYQIGGLLREMMAKQRDRTAERTSDNENALPANASTIKDDR